MSTIPRIDGTFHSSLFYIYLIKGISKSSYIP